MQELREAPVRKRRVERTFVDDLGVKHQRTSVRDIETLQMRTVNPILDIKGLEQNRELHELVTVVLHLYESAAYPMADYRIGLALQKEPALEPFLYYYKRVCERVIAIPLTAEEKAYEARCIHHRKLPRWLRSLRPVETKGRCKWCARYTRWIDPNDRMHESNLCQHCKRRYPMPSVIWDGSEGRAYCYYRGSHEDRAFYDEFERDYAADPR